MAKLSIIIPSRNEQFLARTIEDILDKMRGDTEIIAGLDGQWADPSIIDHPKVHIIYHSESIGQRAISNEMAKFSNAKYIMKVDAHCAFAEGFDVQLMADMQDNWTMVPIMRNLHAFDWKCRKCGDTRYQGPTPTSCPKCDNTTDFEKDMKWIGKTNPQSTSYCFDSEPHFQYFQPYKERPEYKNSLPLTETMSLQGSCFMLTRDKYFELNICDESFGSWGSQGIEVAVKTWLSGGRVVVNHNTWYAHMFRTQGGDFGFPYQISGNQVQRAKKLARDVFFNNKWPQQIHPLSWLLERFWPVPGWTDDQLASLKKGEKTTFKSKATPSTPVPQSSTESRELTKGMVYYTDNQCDPVIADAVRRQLSRIAKEKGMIIVNVSLKPLDWENNIVLPLERGILTMTQQILAGLLAIDTDIVFFTEHDVLYHPSHFDFVPPMDNVYYYNENTYKVRSSDGQAVFFYCKQTSGCCAYRKTLVEHYKKRLERIEKEGFSRSMGFEPGCHHLPNGVDNLLAREWMSEVPNVDIRHDKNLTWSRFKPEQYRSQRSIRGWKLVDEVPGWGRTKDRFSEFLREAVK